MKGASGVLPLRESGRRTGRVKKRISRFVKCRTADFYLLTLGRKHFRHSAPKTGQHRQRDVGVVRTVVYNDTKEKERELLKGRYVKMMI